MANKYASLIASAVTAIAQTDKAQAAFETLCADIKKAKIKAEELKEVMLPALAKRRGLGCERKDTGATAGQLGFVGDDKACAAARKELQRWTYRISLSMGWIEKDGNNQTDPATKLFKSIEKMDGRSRNKLIRLMKEEGWI